MLMKDFVKVKNIIYSYLPELKDVNFDPLHLKIYITKKSRIMVIGGLNGILRITVYNHHSKKIVKSETIQMDSPISSIEFFKIKGYKSGNVNSSYKDNKTIQYLKNHPSLSNKDANSSFGSDERLSKLNIIVAQSIGKINIFWNVKRDLLSNSSVMKYNNDTILCVYPVDINGNGINEILVGTYSRCILVYRYDFNKKKYKRKSEKYPFHSPIYSINSLDLTNDGIQELVVVTMKNLSILQKDMHLLQEKLNIKLQKLSQLKPFSNNKEN